MCQTLLVEFPLNTRTLHNPDSRYPTVKANVWEVSP